MRRLILLLLIGPLFAQQGNTVYGNGFQGNGLTNLEIGKFTGRKLDIRFSAEHAGSGVSSISLFIKTGVGYSLGTGGITNVSLQTDDGTSNHFPSGSQLDVASAATGNPASPTVHTFPLSGGVKLTLGTLYHIVLTNIDADPVNNYVSLDDMNSTNNTTAPYYANPVQLNCALSGCYQNFAILWQQTAPPWALKTNHLPIVAITYADGYVQGQTYTDSLAGSGLFNIQGTNQAGQLFNPTSNRSINSANVWVQKVGSPPAGLVVALQTAAGAAITSATVPAASVNTSFGWVSAKYSSFQTLTASSSYRVVLSCSSCDVSNYYQVYPMQDGATLGMPKAASQFSQSAGNYQTNTGSGWNNPACGTCYAMSLFLSDSLPVTFVSQSGGTFTGGSSCNGQSTISVATYNSSGTSPAVLCGVITSQVVPPAGGTSSNPVLITFDTGASIQMTPGAPSTGALNLGSNSWITVDGGTNKPCGWNVATNATEGTCNGQIESMLYGSPGATCPGGTCTTQPTNTSCPGNALISGSGSNIEIRNLNLGPSYVHTATTNDTLGTPGICKNVGGNNWNIHDNKLHDGGWFVTIASGSGITMTSNDLYNDGHMVAGDCSGNCSNITFSGNYCHDMQNWDTSSDWWHNNCIHLYTNTAGQSMTNITVNNNIMTGHMGQNATGQIFFETNGGSLTNFAVFNNVLGNLDTTSTAPERLLDISNCNSSCKFYNNTAVGPNVNWGWGAQIGYSGGPSVAISAMENNAIQTVGYLNESNSTTYTTLDYNGYGNFGQGWKWGSTTINVFSTWKSSSGEGTHSIFNSGGLTLGSNYVPLSGSPLIGAGVNVCTVDAAFCSSFPAIQSDITGSPRPGVGAWTIGAYNFPQVAGNATGSVQLKGVLFK